MATSALPLSFHLIPINSSTHQFVNPSLASLDTNYSHLSEIDRTCGRCLAPLCGISRLVLYRRRVGETGQPQGTFSPNASGTAVTSAPPHESLNARQSSKGSWGRSEKLTRLWSRPRTQALLHLFPGLSGYSHSRPFTASSSLRPLAPTIVV